MYLFSFFLTVGRISWRLTLAQACRGHCVIYTAPSAVAEGIADEKKTIWSSVPLERNATTAQQDREVDAMSLFSWACGATGVLGLLLQSSFRGGAKEEGVAGCAWYSHNASITRSFTPTVFLADAVAKFLLLCASVLQRYNSLGRTLESAFLELRAPQTEGSESKLRREWCGGRALHGRRTSGGFGKRGFRSA